MQKMADMLAEDGHEVDIIMNNRLKNHVITKHAGLINFDVPEDIDDTSSVKIEDLGMKGLAFFHTVERLKRYKIPSVNTC